MSNLDLINAYFGNEMTAMERQEFENKLQKDTELKKEFDFQKEVIKAVRERRRTQLKAMLDNVPVSGGTTGGSGALIKGASTVALIGLAALGVYFLMPDEAEKNTPAEQEQTAVKPSFDKNTESTRAKTKEEKNLPESRSTAEEKPEIVQPNVPDRKVQESSDEEITGTPEINRPDQLPTFDTHEDLTDSLEAPGSNVAGKVYNDHSSVDVQINSESKKYNFHYQFKGGKLLLFGTFDQGLYEILDINQQGGKTVFLYYKNKFYHLRKDESKILPLEPVQSSSLIERLEKTRKQR